MSNKKVWNVTTNKHQQFMYTYLKEKLPQTMNKLSTKNSSIGILLFNDRKNLHLPNEKWGFKGFYLLLLQPRKF